MSGPSWRSTSLDFAAAPRNCSRSRLPTEGMSRSMMNLRRAIFVSQAKRSGGLCCLDGRAATRTGCAQNSWTPRGAMKTPAPFARPRPDTQPPYLYPDYASTVKRSPKRPPIRLEHTLSETTGPVFGDRWAGADATDLTRQHKGAPLGERMILNGRVLDEDGRPVPGTLIELWQCNSAGRYHHPVDQHDAPLDPNFTGAGQVVTNAEGGYRCLTTKPGA